MITPGVFLRAVRAPSLTAGAMPVLTCTALVHYQGLPVHLGGFALTLVGMLAIQCAANLVNDLYDDESGLDADPEFARNPFPLGSRVIQSGALSRRGVAALAAACAGVATLCGLWLNGFHPGNTILWIALAAALLGWSYSAPPLRIAYHGAGEPVTFLLFGPLAGLGSYYVQTGRFDAAALALSSVVGLLAMAILYMHHFPQHAADRRHGKRTPIVRLGPTGAGRLVPAMLAVPFAGVAGAALAGFLPAAALLFFLTAPLALAAARSAWRDAEDARRMTRAFAHVLGVHFAGGLLLSAGLVLAA